MVRVRAFLGRAGERHAVGVHVGDGLAPAVANDVVEVALLEPAAGQLVSTSMREQSPRRSAERPVAVKAPPSTTRRTVARVWRSLSRNPRRGSDGVRRNKVDGDVHAGAVREHAHTGGPHERGRGSVAVERKRDGECQRSRGGERRCSRPSLARTGGHVDRGLGLLSLLGSEHGGAHEEVEIGAHVGPRPDLEVAGSIARGLGVRRDARRRTGAGTRRVPHRRCRHRWPRRPWRGRRRAPQRARHPCSSAGLATEPSEAHGVVSVSPHRSRPGSYAPGRRGSRSSSFILSQLHVGAGIANAWRMVMPGVTSFINLIPSVSHSTHLGVNRRPRRTEACRLLLPRNLGHCEESRSILQ